jgi:hypothetical protein
VAEKAVAQELLAVVGRQDDPRVVVDSERGQVRDQSADAAVGVADLLVVERLDEVDLGRRQRRPPPGANGTSACGR